MKIKQGFELYLEMQSSQLWHGCWFLYIFGWFFFWLLIPMCISIINKDESKPPTA